MIILAGKIGYVEIEFLQFIILVNKFVVVSACTAELSTVVSNLSSHTPYGLESSVQDNSQQNVCAYSVLLIKDDSIFFIVVDISCCTPFYPYNNAKSSTHV